MREDERLFEMLYEQGAAYGPSWRGAVSGLGAMKEEHGDLRTRKYVVVNVGALPTPWRCLQERLGRMDDDDRFNAGQRRMRNLSLRAARLARVKALVESGKVAVRHAAAVYADFEFIDACDDANSNRATLEAADIVDATSGLFNKVVV